MSAEVVTSPKRVVPSLINTQVIIPLLRSLSHLIRAIHLKILEDNVHLLTPIPTTLVQTEVEVMQISEAEDAEIFSSNFVVAIILVVTQAMAIEPLLRIITNLQVQTPMARKRRSVVLQTLLVSHQMVSIMKTAKMRLMMLMKKPVSLLCLVPIPHSTFLFWIGRLVLLANIH